MESDLAGMEVVAYDGTNADAIIEALKLEVGDGVVVIPGYPLLLRAKTIDGMRNPSEGKILVG